MCVIFSASMIADNVRLCQYPQRTGWKILPETVLKLKIHLVRQWSCNWLGIIMAIKEKHACVNIHKGVVTVPR